MNKSNQLPSFNDTFSNLYSSSLGLVEQEQQFDDSEQQSIYQGMTVQLVSHFPIYNSVPDTYQNEADHSNSLNEYNIESLTNFFDLENASETGIQELPQSILDEYVPYQSDNEPVNDALSPSTPCIQQLLLRDEPEIREQTSANHIYPDIQLTNPTAGIHSSQDLRPVAVVNPLCMDQATSDNQKTQAEVNVDGSSSLVERQREHQRKRQREHQRERQRERYQTDPAYAEGQRIYLNTYKRIKREISNKEEAKEQAVIARDQYLQSVNSAKNSGDLPLTSNLAETTQSSSKNLDGTALPPLFSRSRQTEGIFTIPIDPISP